MRGILGKKRMLLPAGVLIALTVHLILPGLPAQQRIMAAIFALTVFYWLTEPIPPYVTALVAAFGCATLLGPLAPRLHAEALDYSLFLNAFASPVVALLFGGFVMAQIFGKNNLDIEFARMVLVRLGSRPSVVLAGMMAITAAMSMWMSNTATTAIMVAAVLPIVRKLPRDSNMVRTLMLGIPFAANVGGIATPIGTTPNAIAIGLLADSGVRITFLSWMLVSFPIMILMLAVTFLLLRLFFPIKRHSFTIAVPERPTVANRTLVYVVFFATVALWITDQLHGIPAALVAMVPVLVFAIGGQLTKRQLREIAWDILLLIGGGIALGVGIKQTGLADTIVAALLPSGLSQTAVILVLSTLVAALATFMSNTAASNIVLPLAVAVAAAGPARLALPIALCASFGMALPISTPPNAIAYGSELIAARDMLRVGALVTLCGVVLTLVLVGTLLNVVPALRSLG